MREQGTYLPECLDEIISPENPIRFIRLFVLQLDLARIGFVRSKPRETGRPGYDSAVLLMLVHLRSSEPDPVLADAGVGVPTEY